MKNYRLHLIRHGFSEDNKANLLGGCGRDVSVTEEGKQALLQMKETYSYPHVNALFVSPMKRAVQTAELLYPTHERILIAPLVETSYGALEGKPIEEVMKEDFFPNWMHPENPVTPDGAETYLEFRARAVAAVSTLLEGMMKSGITDAAAITHGNVIAAVVSALGLPEQPEDMWYADNGTGYTLSTAPDMWMRSNKAEITAIQPLGYMEALNREE